MNPKLVSILTLRALAQLFSAQGVRGDRQAKTLMSIANAIEAGAAVDDHMQTVANALKAGESADWQDIHSRIESEAAELRNREPG